MMLKATNQLVITGESGREAKLWIRDRAMVGDNALEQIGLMLKVPRLFEHIAVMPDVHWGMGCTVGAVMALDNAVIPNCVGVDIGCGMAAYPLGLRYDGELKQREFWRQWLGAAMRNVPSGFNCQPQQGERLEQLKLVLGATLGHDPVELQLHCGAAVAPAKKFHSLGEMVQRQAGTLGGGNHFLEIQRDQDDELWLMVHSGSRNIGLKIANHYHELARQLNAREVHAAQPHLNWLPLDTPEGQSYLHDMQWAVDYALLNRMEMLRVALSPLKLVFDAAKMINIPHNYAAVEEHFGQMVVVHRKGATSARVDELGIIPGSMGTPSYIVRGLGNPDSFNSCSHGAGRAMGRKQAKRTLNTNDFAQAVAQTYSSPSQAYLDEAPQAYKNIDLVLNAQDDLVTIVRKLKPVITLKSGDDSYD
jgi:tRNA-splicing ligase RtcB (3'-phosphate/5'-hydroxy nucleic acid ligase)